MSTEQNEPITLLLGAEGCSELNDRDWIRPATDEEIERALNGSKSPDMIDGVNRHYWWMTITGDAPVWARESAIRSIRKVRL